MAHILSNRYRIQDLTTNKEELKKQFRWDTINAITYKIGGLLFVIGSFFLFPARSEHASTGGAIFLTASLLYLIVNVHDLLEIRRYWKSQPTHNLQLKLEYFAGISYLLGTLCFVCGRICSFSTVGLSVTGTWLFISGSILFVFGALSNVLLIIKESSVQQLQLMNLTAICFVIGSLLFALATIPYLWRFESAKDQLTIFNFVAWQYMLGSSLFFLGGIFNYFRSYLLIQDAISR
ncbi:YrhK family protein [Photobacterium sp. DNB22_13_2]